MIGRRTAAAALVVLPLIALASCSASAKDTPATTAATQGAQSAGCGAAAPEVLAQAAGAVATKIYAGEAGSSATRADQREVEGYAPLLSAVANGEAAAVKAAVTSLDRKSVV